MKCQLSFAHKMVMHGLLSEIWVCQRYWCLSYLYDGVLQFSRCKWCAYFIGCVSLTTCNFPAGSLVLQAYLLTKYFHHKAGQQMLLSARSHKVCVNQQTTEFKPLQNVIIGIARNRKCRCRKRHLTNIDTSMNNSPPLLLLFICLRIIVQVTFKRSTSTTLA